MMNTTFQLAAGFIVATALPTSAFPITCEQNNPQPLHPTLTKYSTSQIISPININTDIFPDTYFKIIPPKNKYIEAFKKMRQSKTLKSIYENASIGEVMSVE